MTPQHRRQSLSSRPIAVAKTSETNGITKSSGNLEVTVTETSDLSDRNTWVKLPVKPVIHKQVMEAQSMKDL